MELNKIYNMDCLEGIKKIADKSINLIVTDPPYFLGMTHNGHKGVFEDLIICKPFYQQLAQEFGRVLKEDGEFYIFCDWKGYAFYYPIFSAELPVRNMIVWDKQSGPGNMYNYQHELIIYGTMMPKNRGGANVWRIPGYSSPLIKERNKLHPTQKPLEVIEKIITDASKEGDTVLDCFMGAGTTALASMKTGRNFIGFEINEKYFYIANKRIEENEQV